MPSATDHYAAMLDAVDEQQLRLFGPRPADIWTGQSAAQFRFDPRRELDPNLAALASYVQPGDVVVDVGGGAGRVSLAVGPALPRGADRGAVRGDGRRVRGIATGGGHHQRPPHSVGLDGSN